MRALGLSRRRGARFLVREICWRCNYVTPDPDTGQERLFRMTEREYRQRLAKPRTRCPQCLSDMALDRIFNS